jgi:hypothetical protein
VVSPQEVHHFVTALISVKTHEIFRQAIRLDNLSHIEREIREASGRSRLFIQLPHGEHPACILMPGMFTCHPIQPTFDTAGEQKIILVDGQNTALHDDPLEQPIRDRDRHSLRFAGAFLSDFRPAFEPVEGSEFLFAI